MAAITDQLFRKSIEFAVLALAWTLVFCLIPKIAHGRTESVKTELIESINIPADQRRKFTTRTVLENGKTYLIEAKGTFSVWRGRTSEVDALWCFRKGRCGKNGQAWGQLIINGQNLNTLNSNYLGKKREIPYNPKHVYNVWYRGQGKVLEMWIYDAYVAGSHVGNSGSLTVNIYQSASVGVQRQTSSVSNSTTDLSGLSRDELKNRLRSVRKEIAEELVRVENYLTYYNQALVLSTLSGRLNKPEADRQLREKGSHLYNKSFTDDDLFKLKGRHRQSAGLFFNSVEKKVRESNTWPDRNAADEYRALALSLITDIRKKYETSMNQGHNPAAQLVDALELSNWASGQRKLPSSANPFADERDLVIAAIPDEPLQKRLRHKDKVRAYEAPSPSLKPIPISKIVTQPSSTAGEPVSGSDIQAPDTSVFTDNRTLPGEIAIEVNPDGSIEEESIQEAIDKLLGVINKGGNLAQPPATDAQKTTNIPPSQNQAQQYNATGDQLFNQGRYGEAISYYLAAANLLPTEGKFRANLAGTYYQLGRQQEATLQARDALRLGYRDHWVFTRLGLQP